MKAIFPCNSSISFHTAGTSLRSATDGSPRTFGRGGAGPRLYRLWWLLFVDVGLHLMIKLMASALKSTTLIRFYYRRVFSKVVVRT